MARKINLSAGLKAFILLVSVVSFILLPPLFYGGNYTKGLSEWGFHALSAIYISAVIWACIGFISRQMRGRRVDDKLKAKIDFLCLLFVGVISAFIYLIWSIEL